MRTLFAALLCLMGMLSTPFPSPAQTGASFAVAVPLTGIVIDGKLDDWPAGLEKHWILHHGQAYGPTDIDDADLKTSADLSPRVMFGYNARENLLYVAVMVRDDKEVPGFGPLGTDGCEIYVEGTRRRTVVSERTSFVTEMMAAVPYDMAANGGSYDTQQFGQTSPQNPILGGGDIARTKTRCAYSRTGDVSVYEWAVEAYDRFPGAPTRLIPGRIIGIDVAVDDFDGEGNPAWVNWGPYKPLKFFNGDSLGEVLLVENPRTVGTVSGTITDPKEKSPLKGFLAGVYRGKDLLGVFRTDDAGRYTMSLPAGDYEVRPMPKQGAATETAKKVAVKSGKNIPADFSPLPVTLPEILAKSVAVYRNLAGYSDSTYIIVRTKDEYGEKEETYPYFLAFQRPGKLRFDFQAEKGSISMFYAGDSLAVYDTKENACMRMKYPKDRPVNPDLTVSMMMELQAPQTRGNLVDQLFLFGGDPLGALSKNTESIRKAGVGTIDGEPATIVEMEKTYDDLIPRETGMPVIGGNARTLTVRLWFGNRDYLLKKVEFSPELELVMRGMPGKAPEGSTGTAAVTILHQGARTNPEFAENVFIFKTPEGAVERPISLYPEKKVTLRTKDLSGKPAPDFTLKDVDGKETSLSECRGNVVVLDFWAALNASSVQALELVQTIHQRFEGKGVRVFGINEFEDESPEDFKSFLREHGITHRVLRDTEGTMVEKYGFTKIPAVFVIDKKGIVRQSYRDKPDGEELAKVVENLLAE